jgi:uncharacterized small protein (DUF1192 family)
LAKIVKKQLKIVRKIKKSHKKALKKKNLKAGHKAKVQKRIALLEKAIQELKAELASYNKK